MKPLVKITENIVEKSLSRLGAIQTHIFLNWNNIAAKYANITLPEKIQFNKNKKTEGEIILKVQNGFGPEIQHATTFLLNQIKGGNIASTRIINQGYSIILLPINKSTIGLMLKL